MSTRGMVTHILVSTDRYRCGKRPQYNTSHTEEFKDVTCKTCKECFQYDDGRIKEYRLGGNFDKDGSRRSRVNHWSYIQELKSKDQRIKQLEDALRDMGEALYFCAQACFYGSEPFMSDTVADYIASKAINKHKELLDSLGKEREA